MKAMQVSRLIVAAALEVDLATVIVFKGPGSWKREARWDEYVVKITNQGEQALVVESAELSDLQGQPRVPGDDPWKLEKLSRSNWDKYGKTGLHLVEGVGAVAVMNHKNKAKVQHEFQGRRLKLPITVTPNEPTAGSLFFPMTPGPQRLIVHGRIGEKPVAVILDLGPLASLHLKPAK
jgi:hypothetical protein